MLSSLPGPAVGPGPVREALLLLPFLPATATVVGPLQRWEPALQAWGITAGSGAEARTELAVGSDARALAGSGAQMVLLEGADRDQRLAAAGYHVRSWRTTATRLGAPALVAGDDDRLARQLRTGGARRRPRQVAADLVRGSSRFTVGLRDPAPPLALREQAPAGPVALLLGAASARRRPVFLLHGAADLRPERVVKVGYGGEAAARGRTEQELLGRLTGLGAGAPKPLGTAGSAGLTWAVETAVPGLPLLDALVTRPAEAGLRLLESVVDHLAELAVATSGPRGGDEALRLRPPYDRAAGLVPAAVPGVLVHGDLPGNVLLDGERIGIVDWETARFGGLPLHDLLPLLCVGLARVRGVPQERSPALLLPALRGEGPEGPWLLHQVRRTLDRLGVPLQHGGALAAHALGAWASMRLVHDELVRAAGGAVTAWTSPAETLAPAWFRDPQLGTTWRALTR